jgi:hypothetical protein
MNSVKYAYSLNNQGVDLLLTGEAARAIIVFERAVGLLKKAVQEAETSSFIGMDQSYDYTSLLFSESISTIPGLNCLHCYVYDHGIVIPGNGSNGETQVMITLNIAIVLFNLALASHCEGTVFGRAKSLKKASVLYSLAGQLLARCKMLKTASTTTLTLFALNNKAQIHYDHCEYVQHIDCINYVSRILGSGRVVHSAQNHEGVEGLLLNVMLLSAPSAAQAA